MPITVKALTEPKESVQEDDKAAVLSFLSKDKAQAYNRVEIYKGTDSIERMSKRLDDLRKGVSHGHWLDRVSAALAALKAEGKIRSRETDSGVEYYFAA